MQRIHKLLWPLILLWLIVGALLWSNNARADVSAEKTDDVLITTGYGDFLGIIVVTDGTNAVTVDIYDNTSATGRKLIPTTVITTSATDRLQAIGYGLTEVPYLVGIFVDITCSGTVKYMVIYQPKNR